MNVALDFDGTYTRDPELWNAFISLAKERGHTVKICTMRYPHEVVPDLGIEVVYTSRKAKFGTMEADIWIDDMPQLLFENSA